MCIVFGLWEETRHTWGDHKERPCNEVIEHPQRNNQKLIANIYLIICNMLQLKMVFMHAAILAWIFLNIFFIYITGYPGLILSESYVWLQQSNSHISEREWWWQAKEKKAKKRDICSKTTEHFLPSENIWALLKVQADDETAQWTQDIVWCSSKLINEFRLSKLSFSMNKPSSKTD